MNLDGVERYSYFKDKWFGREKKYRRKKTTLILFLFLIAILAILVVYFFVFSGQIVKQEKSVKLKIETPEQIFVGQDFDLKISVLDEENTDLIDSELFISFPEKFHYLSSEPSCSEVLPAGCFIRFPRLKRNEQKEIKLTGKLFGLPNDKKIFETKITFQLENFSSWFKKVADKEIILNQPPFDLEFSGSEELLGAEGGEFRIKMKNSGDRSTSVRIILVSPADFNFINLSLAAQEGKDNQKIWDINLEPNEEKIIDFTGYFSDQIGEKRFILQIGILGLEKEFFLQQEEEKIVKIAQPGLVLGLKVNDSFAEEIIQNFGDTINASFSYKNISQEKIFEPLFKLKINPSFVVSLEKNDNWRWQQGEKNIIAENWRIEEKDNGIFTFSSPEITEINPGEEGEIKINLRIKNKEEITENQLINNIILAGETEARVFHQQTIIFKTVSNQITLKLSQ